MGRVWGRLWAFGEPRGMALLSSNNSSELGAVGLALSILVAAERHYGPPRTAAVYADIRPLIIEPTEAALRL